ncbi:predicted protein [Nematostella vectensis]|uniref:G-protein coupled receptors family 1 profile domain-containing protein n=1 Tax=Nematostella vectensis TaxID=45351 RepID=A7RU21_NEMVE|nr:predicted protein [Nematostella vectensis]|eukprot:XP_001637070.1 predicted protein [Nematostella vectensis]
MASNSSSRTCFFLVYDHERILRARNAYIAAAVFNCITMLPAIVLNVLLMMGMYRSPALRKPSTLLLYSLSASDLLLCMIVQPGYVAKKVGRLTDSFSLYCKSGILTYTMGVLLNGVSFLNLTAIAFDRFLIVTSRIHYQEKVTKQRVIATIASIWILMTVLPIIQFWVTRATAFMITATFIISCIVITTLCYVLYTQIKPAENLKDIRQQL